MAANIFKFQNNFHRFNNFMKIGCRFLKRYDDVVDPLPTRYGGKSNVTILPGVGIGPELMEETLKLLKFCGAPLLYEVIPTVLSNEDEDDDDKYEADFLNMVKSVKRNRYVLKGNLDSTRSTNLNLTRTSRNVNLRKRLNLFVYVLQAKSYPNIGKYKKPLDIVMVRKNTEDKYLMLEHVPKDGTVESLKIISRLNSERVARYAFEYCEKNNRKHVTVFHTAYIQPMSEGVFLTAFNKIRAEYPHIGYRAVQFSTGVNKLCQHPELFDVISATNFNGNLLSLCLTGMVGGPGMTAGMHYGILDNNEFFIFEPGARNKGMSLIGQNRANPIAMFLATCKLLRHLNETDTANMISDSIYDTIVFDNIRTFDIGGKSTTQDVTDRVMYHVKMKKTEKTFRDSFMKTTLEENIVPRGWRPKSTLSD